MVDCSLCSFLGFIFGCIYSVCACALEYPFVVFLLSLLMGIVFVTNVHMAKLICGNGCAVNRSSSNTGSAAESNSNYFDYGAEHGPHTWCSSGLNQSPINIIDNCVQKFPIRELLTWNHYDDLPNGIMLENTGHTVLLRASFNGNAPAISGADLLACYTFVELCFRWSASNNEGSEHMLNYKKFPLELQAMHRTGPAGDCTSSYDLLMIAYFFEISTNNPYLDPIIQNLHRIQKAGSKIEIPPFPLCYLLYQFRTGFYSYGGSLTEPPCYEGAEWFIFPETLAIGERQLQEFRQLLSNDGHSRIISNARPVQQVNASRLINLNQYNPIEAACHMPTAPECSPQCEDEESFE